MNLPNTISMEKTEKTIKEPTVLELIFRDKQDLKNLSNKEEFITFIVNDKLDVELSSTPASKCSSLAVK